MARDGQQLLKDRARLMGPNLPTFYDEPVHVVRGEGVWLWDADGRIGCSTTSRRAPCSVAYAATWWT